MSVIKLKREFYQKDALELAPDLLGKIICRKLDDGSVLRLRITETEAYRGSEDLACHASKGRTPRTEVMYGESGMAYVYLIYGIHWLLNIVSGGIGEPQAVLIRACEGYNGPGKLTKYLGIDKSFYGENFYESKRIWIEEDGYAANIIRDKRVGISYAGEYWANINWRFIDCQN